MLKLSKKKSSKKNDANDISIGNWRKKLYIKYYGYGD